MFFRGSNAWHFCYRYIVTHSNHCGIDEQFEIIYRNPIYT